MTTENTPPPSGETPGGGTSPQGETPLAGTGETPGTTPTAPADLQREIERLSNALKRANAEAKAEREAAADLKKFKEQIESERLSEQEKQAKRLAELQREREDALLQLQETRLVAATQLAAAHLAFNDPEDALAFIERRRADLEYDERGQPANVEDILKQLLASKPYLAKPAQAAPPEPSQQQPTPPHALDARLGLSRPLAQQPPVTPPMNPGRSSIPAPGTVPAGRRPSLSEAHVLARQQGQSGGSGA